MPGTVYIDFSIPINEKITGEPLEEIKQCEKYATRNEGRDWYWAMHYLELVDISLRQLWREGVLNDDELDQMLRRFGIIR